MATPVNSTLIVEDIFKGMFEQLPELEDSKGNLYKPRFEWGDQFDLLDFLKQNKGGERPYPLIWLMCPYNEVQTKVRSQLTDVSLILAAETTTEMLPSERLEVIFKPILIPLLKNIKQLFLRSNTIDVGQTVYGVTKYYNYSGEDNQAVASEMSDIWDALKITFSGEMNSSCQNIVKFNK